MTLLTDAHVFWLSLFGAAFLLGGVFWLGIALGVCAVVHAGYIIHETW